MRGAGFEMSETQVCDLEISVIWRGCVSAQDKNVGWLNIFMPSDCRSIRNSPYQVDDDMCLPIQDSGRPAFKVRIAMNSHDPMRNIEQPIPEE